MAVIINDEQKVPLTVVAKNNSGKVVAVDGPPAWSSSDVNIVSLVVAPDGLSAEAFSVGLGNATISVIADADLTPAVREISASIDISVVAAEATVLELTAGTPVAK